MKSIELPKTLKEIDDYAFDMAGVQKIIFPEGLVRIGYHAFLDASLSEVYIPASVVEIGEMAFGCNFYFESSLYKITVSKENEFFWSEGNCLVTKDGTLIAGCNGSVIPEGVVTIAENVFQDCYLGYVNMPDSVVEIREGAFRYSTITGIKFSENLLNMGYEAFAGVYELKEVCLPESLEYMGGSIFYGSTYLEKVVCSASILSIGSGCFWNCKNLKSVTLPQNLSVIGDNMFKGCYELKEIIIPNTVVEIGESAFYECSSLEMPLLPDSLETIGKNAFWDCDSLDEVIIPKSVVKIEGGAFGDCYSIIKCLIPSSVTSMMSDIFFWSDNVILYVEQGSVAESYAKEYGIPYKY